jgi:hypothetical protein
MQLVILSSFCYLRLKYNLPIILNYFYLPYLKLIVKRKSNNNVHHMNKMIAECTFFSLYNSVVQLASFFEFFVEICKKVPKNLRLPY